MKSRREWAPSAEAIRRAVVLVTGVAVSLVSPALYAQSPKPQRIPGRALNSVQFDLRELFRVGSMDGQHDAFGRVMSAALDGRARLFVVDNLKRQIVVFGRAGEFVATIGRDGDGPGEFRSPWLVAVDAADSIFVWDPSQARVSVFDPQLEFRRSFRVPPHWLINSWKFLPTGEIALAAYGRGERAGIHILDRSGVVVRAFGTVPVPSDLAGFEGSLLGGSLDVGPDSLIIYSRKSPYEVLVYDIGGRLRAHCIGDPRTTTPPDAVVQRRPSGTGLSWNRFVHSSSVVSIGSAVFANTILDPVREVRTIDILDGNCRLLRRAQLPGPITIVDRRGSHVVAVTALEYPEVIVYSAHLQSRR